MKKFTKSFSEKPKSIFLADGFGALLTALLLFFVIRTFNYFFGLSKITLEYLSLIALIFSVYSILCYFLIKNNWKPFLKIICASNIFYCLLTFSIILNKYESISAFGIVYFLGEIAVIIGLVILEIKTIREKF